MTNKDQLSKVIKDYGLHAEDVFIHASKGYKIIKRRGYKRIQAQLKIDIKFALAHSNGVDSCVIIATGHTHGTPMIRETLGEASPRNSTFKYPHAVAQKRAEGRLILEIAGLYEDGWMTEDEIDETVVVEKAKNKATKTGEKAEKGALQKLGLGEKN